MCEWVMCGIIRPSMILLCELHWCTHWLLQNVIYKTTLLKSVRLVRVCSVLLLCDDSFAAQHLKSFSSSWTSNIHVIDSSLAVANLLYTAHWELLLANMLGQFWHDPCQFDYHPNALSVLPVDPHGVNVHVELEELCGWMMLCEC